jgi:ABC-type polar amino acid transport system ATPase subunit
MITVDKVWKSFHGTEILRGVSFSVAAGETCVLLGPSGGGKSTLLRTINGLEAIDSGMIQVGETRLVEGDGPDREAALAAIRRRVGIVFQQYQLFPHRTALENVIEGPVYVLRCPREAAIEEARILMDRLGLASCARLLPRNLSGGQQQRVAIARALAMHPDVILFDEPTSALDPKMTAEVASLIADLRADGQTMLIVTHAVPFAREIAQRVHYLRDGQIVASGTPEQVLPAGD